MSNRKQRLELIWISKDKRPRLEPRILIGDVDKSYHAKTRLGENDIFDNRLLFGDNLLALKALEPEFSGKIKCIYIDPAFNTGEAVEHYDDGQEHSIWPLLRLPGAGTWRELDGHRSTALPQLRSRPPQGMPIWFAVRKRRQLSTAEQYRSKGRRKTGPLKL